MRRLAATPSSETRAHLGVAHRAHVALFKAVDSLSGLRGKGDFEEVSGGCRPRARMRLRRDEARCAPLVATQHRGSPRLHQTGSIGVHISIERAHTPRASRCGAWGAFLSSRRPVSFFFGPL